jgi:hypothetical protein
VCWGQVGYLEAQKRVVWVGEGDFACAVCICVAAVDEAGWGLERGKTDWRIAEVEGWWTGCFTLWGRGWTFFL